MSGVKWSVEEIEELRRLYPTSGWAVMLRAFPTRTKAAIRCQVIALDIRRLRNSRTPWTGAELMLLRKLYPRTPWPQICAAIPRHPQQAIAKMANTMKVKRDGATKQSRFRVIRELRALRRDSGVEQRRLAERIGVHSVQLAQWERGTQMPRLRSFFDWVEALGCRVELQRVGAAA